MPRDDDADYSRYVNGGDSDNHYDYDDCDDYQYCDYFYDLDDDDGERRKRSLMMNVMTPALYATIG